MTEMTSGGGKKFRREIPSKDGTAVPPGSARANPVCHEPDPCHELDSAVPEHYVRGFFFMQTGNLVGLA